MNLAGIGALGALLAAAPLRAQTPRPLPFGATVRDSLTTRDPVMRTRSAPFHLWTFQGHRGQRVSLEMSSSDFDTYLIVRDPDGLTVGRDDDGGEGTDSRVHAVLPRDGTYRVVATAFSAGAVGSYTLEAGVWLAPPSPPPAATPDLRVGAPQNGMLEPGDRVSPDGPYEDHWFIDAAVGARLRVELRSSDFDAWLSILGPDGHVVGSDDDGLGDRDAVVAIRTTMAGRYTAIATSLGDDPAAGTYSIQLVDETGLFADPGEAASIATGETREGRLETGDATGRRGFEDRWTFQGRTGQVARLDVTSTSMDPYIVLRYDGVPLDSNDDGGSGTNARLTTVLTGNGTYTAIVSSYRESTAGGRYAVSLNLAPPAAGPGQVARVAPGQRLSGRLESGDRPRAEGGFQDWWEFDGRAGQVVTIAMRATGFDAYLELLDQADSHIAGDDDGGDGTDALLVAELPTSGRYRVVARSYGSSQATGLYEMEMNLATTTSTGGRGGVIAAGQLVVGRLEQGDSVVGDGTYADTYTFRADRSGDLVIDMQSGDFDTYLMLLDDAGHTVASDDDGGTGTNSQITAHVSQGRTYSILANSFGAESVTGAYRLSVRMSP